MAVNPADFKGKSGAARRARLLAELLAKLIEAPMSRSEIQEFLCFSPAGSRKYIGTLRSNGALIVVDRTGAHGEIQYGATKNQLLIDAFLDLIKSKAEAAAKNINAGCAVARKKNPYQSQGSKPPKLPKAKPQPSALNYEKRRVVIVPASTREKDHPPRTGLLFALFGQGPAKPYWPEQEAA